MREVITVQTPMNINPSSILLQERKKKLKHYVIRTDKSSYFLKNRIGSDMSTSYATRVFTTKNYSLPLRVGRGLRVGAGLIVGAGLTVGLRVGRTVGKTESGASSTKIPQNSSFRLLQGINPSLRRTRFESRAKLAVEPEQPLSPVDIPWSTTLAAAIGWFVFAR